MPDPVLRTRGAFTAERLRSPCVAVHVLRGGWLSAAPRHLGKLLAAPLQGAADMSQAMPTVGDYMTPGAYVVACDEYASRARGMMRAQGIRHLPVTKNGKVVGIVSDRDLAWAQSLRPGGALVDEAMSVNLYVVSPDALLNVVARAMAKRKCGSAIVMDKKGVVGVFTTTDALFALSEALEGKVSRRSADHVGSVPSRGRGAPS